MSSPTGPTPPRRRCIQSHPHQSLPEPTGPGLSEPQRLVNTFIAPSKTFTDIRRNASWWVPLFLICIFSIAFFVMIDKKVGFEQVARTTCWPTIRPFSSWIPRSRNSLCKNCYRPESWRIRRADLHLDLCAGDRGSPDGYFQLHDGCPGIFRSVDGNCHVWVVAGNSRQSFAMFALAFGDAEGFRMDNPIGTNPRHFMDPTTTSKFLYAMLTSIDVISIWMSC